MKNKELARLLGVGMEVYIDVQWHEQLTALVEGGESTYNELVNEGIGALLRERKAQALFDEQKALSKPACTEVTKAMSEPSKSVPSEDGEHPLQKEIVTLLRTTGRQPLCEISRSLKKADSTLRLYISRLLEQKRIVKIEVTKGRPVYELPSTNEGGR